MESSVCFVLTAPVSRILTMQRNPALEKAWTLAGGMTVRPAVGYWINHQGEVDTEHVNEYVIICPESKADAVKAYLDRVAADLLRAGEWAVLLTKTAINHKLYT